MSEEEQPVAKKYVIIKYGDDGKSYQDKSSKDYTGKVQVQYTNGYTYH